VSYSLVRQPLRRHRTDLAAAPGRRVVPMRMPSPRILLVDDEPDVLTFMREVLENAGDSVLAAPGGPEALRLVTQHPDPFKWWSSTS
jgi:PleD family two-component response regulator